LPRFSANISMMFLEHDFLDRFQAAKDAGFGAIEIQFPYDISPEDLLAAKESAGVEIAVINIGAGDLTTGGPGIAAMPGREDQFKEAVEQACRYAEVLKPINMNVLPGWPPMDQFSRDECLDVLAVNLHHAAEGLASTGTRALVEAVNTPDRPGFLLYTSAQAIETIDAAGHENLAIEYDLYHMQIMEGNLVNRMTEILDRIGHIQFADTPGRHEPGTGEINYPFVFEEIDKMGWQGWLGAEYVPTRKTTETLEWLQPYL
jgi:hydroxypyruvate isomerase